MLRRTIKILFIFFALALLGAGFGVYLLHHNRNQIVGYLSDQLRDHSNINLKIEDTSIGFRKGITFDLLNIHARSDSDSFSLKAPRLHIRLEFLPLLKGDIVSTRAELRKPEIIWHPAAGHRSESDTEPRPDSSPQPWWEISTDTLTFILSTWRHIVCTDARIEIHTHEEHPLTFRDVALSLSQGGISTPLRANFTGTMQPSAPAEAVQVSIQTRLRAAASRKTLPLAEIDTETRIKITPINVAHAKRYLPAPWNQIRPEGIVELQAVLQGSLAQGLEISGVLQEPANVDKDRSGGAPLRINFNGTGVELGDAEFGATLTYRPESGIDISGLKIKSAFADLKGGAHFSETASRADIHLDHAFFTFAQLRPLIRPLPAAWDELLHNGEIACTGLHYSGSLDPPRLSEIKSGSWEITLPELIRSEDRTTNVAVPSITLEHTDNSFRIQSTPLHWDTDNLKATAELNIKGEWDIQNQTLSARCDLDKSALRYTGVEIKALNAPAHLNFSVTPHSDGWKVFNASLQSAEVDAHGDAQITDLSNFNVNLRLSNFDLDLLHTRIPILERMDLEGRVDLDYHLKRQKGEWNGKGTLNIKDGGITPTPMLGRIHHVNGVAEIDGLGLNAPHLTLQLGQDSSPMQASASIADLRRPVADIHARGDKVVANDLIFNSRTALLYNLKGHICIHAKGMDFIDAGVDLAQGTRARVSGTLGFSTPEMDLDIHATYADIDEVIALWARDDNENGERNKQSSGGIRTTAPKTLPGNETLGIDAHVDKGVFSGFAFQDASGRIHIQRGQLRIDPLRFRADKGKGTGSVVVNLEKHPHLKINGNLNNINADKVYTQIFTDLGLITGALDSTFYLHGPIGSEFISHADGAFSLDVRDGVLRKFKFLSKAFSLLNVAQLFKMQLPDMASEGMPFKHLHADLTMEDGVLSSNNLLIRSEAMNLALAGEFSLPRMQIDAAMALNPLGTVDSIFSKIPVAGWLLTGEKRTIITVEFDISGPAREPIVSMKPLSSVSNQMFGILKRALALPGTTFTDPGKVFFHQERKEENKNDGTTK
jgi:hypothetical protein